MPRNSRISAKTLHRQINAGIQEMNLTRVRALEEIEYLYGRGMVEIALACLNAGQLSVQEFSRYCNIMVDTFTDVRKAMISDAREMGEVVQKTALERFESTRKREVDPRTYQRLHGTLERALQRMVTPTTDGVVIRTDILDSEAEHWRRLNYGVGPNAEEGGSGPIPNLVQEGPSPGPMMMPPGFWVGASGPVPWGEGGGDVFFPMQARMQAPSDRIFRREPSVTRGITGTHFLEYGFAKAEEGFPDRVRKRVQEWSQLSRTRAGRSTIGVIRPAIV